MRVPLLPQALMQQRTCQQFGELCRWPAVNDGWFGARNGELIEQPFALLLSIAPSQITRRRFLMLGSTGSRATDQIAATHVRERAVAPELLVGRAG